MSGMKENERRITILTIGTSGDVYPFIALGNALQEKGFLVCLATHAEFEPIARRYDLSFSLVAGDIHKAFKADKVKASLDAGGKRQDLMESLKDDLSPLYEQGFLDLKIACEGADIVISSALTLHAASYLTDHFNVPLIFCSVSPAGPTSEFHHVLASPPVGPKSAHSAYNQFTHKIYTEVIWKYVRKDLEHTWNKYLPPQSFPKRDPLKAAFERKLPLILYGYSPAILPKPEDWSILQYVTGYWRLPNEDEASTDVQLAEFLNSGSPPVYAGFGSMNNPKDKVLANIVIPAIKSLGERMIILEDGSDLSAFSSDPDIFTIDHANLNWLFPKMKAVIHHGGVGTTGIGIRAGIPTLLVTYIHDQRFWGWRLHQLGAMPKPIPKKELTYKLFVKRLTELLNNLEYRNKTLELSYQMQSECGVETAVNKIEEYLEFRRDYFQES
jgi:sterol 3beta-glucosyltransferase